MLRFGLLVVFVTACGGGGGNAADALCDPDGVWTVWFAKQESCSSNLLGSPDYGVAYQERNCRAMVDPLLDAGTAQLAAPAVIDACRRALETTSCDRAHFKDYRAATAICEDALVGLQQTGEACNLDDECAGASFCASAGTCGACSPKLADGTPCEGGGQCTSGVCAAGSCAAARLGNGATCSVDAQCATGLQCLAGACATALRVGQTCTNGVGCDISQGSCVTPMAGGTFDEHGKCTALGRAGAACSTFDTLMTDRVKCDWLDHLGCIGGACKVLPEVAIGAACGFDVARCAGNASCSQGKCIAIAGENELCQDDAACGPYALCVEHACEFVDFNLACYPDDEPQTPML